MTKHARENIERAAAAWGGMGLQSVMVLGKSAVLRHYAPGIGWRMREFDTPGQAKKARARMCREVLAVDMTDGVGLAQAEELALIARAPYVVGLSVCRGFWRCDALAWGGFVGAAGASGCPVDGMLVPGTALARFLEDLQNSGAVIYGADGLGASHG